MSKKPVALTSFYVLNSLLYGSVLVFFGIYPVVGYMIYPSDMPMGLFATVFAVALFTFALICGWPTYIILKSILSSEDSRLWTLIALFAAPFASIASAFLADKLFPATGYFLFAVPLGFAMPFFIVIALARMKSRKSQQSRQNRQP